MTDSSARLLEEFRNEIGRCLDEQLSERIREGGKKTTSMFSPFQEAMAFHRVLHGKGCADD